MRCSENVGTEDVGTHGFHHVVLCFRSEFQFSELECWAQRHSGEAVRVRYRKMFCSHEAPEQQEGESEEVTWSRATSEIKWRTGWKMMMLAMLAMNQFIAHAASPARWILDVWNHWVSGEILIKAWNMCNCLTAFYPYALGRVLIRLWKACA